MAAAVLTNTAIVWIDGVAGPELHLRVVEQHPGQYAAAAASTRNARMLSSSFASSTSCVRASSCSGSSPDLSRSKNSICSFVAYSCSFTAVPALLVHGSRPSAASGRSVFPRRRCRSGSCYRSFDFTHRSNVERLTLVTVLTAKSVRWAPRWRPRYYPVTSERTRLPPPASGSTLHQV
jgi:hypothetical protein